MTRFEKLRRRWKALVGMTSDQAPWLCLDVGSAYTKVLTAHRSTRIPTCIVRDRLSHQVVAVADAAQQMVGKLPASMECIYPVRFGKIIDPDGCSALLSHLLCELRDERSQPSPLWNLLIPPRVLLVLPLCSSEIQLATWTEGLKRQLARVTGVSMSDVLWRTVTAQHHFIQDGCVVDIGAMTTKYIFYIAGRPVTSTVLQVGGDNWTELIRERLRHEYHLDVSWQAAERMKRQSSLYEIGTQKQTIQGKNLVSGLPETKVVDVHVCTEGAKHIAEQLIAGFSRCAQQSTPEIMSRISETGVYLTGGGSQLAGLPQYLEMKLKISMTCSPAAELESVNGLRQWI